MNILAVVVLIMWSVVKRSLLFIYRMFTCGCSFCISCLQFHVQKLLTGITVHFSNTYLLGSLIAALATSTRMLPSRSRLMLCTVPTAALRLFSTAKGESFDNESWEELVSTTKNLSCTAVAASSWESAELLLQVFWLKSVDDMFFLEEVAMMS